MDDEIVTNPFFKEQVRQSADYFDNWLYTGVSKIFIQDGGEPFRRSFYCDLYDVFLAHHNLKTGISEDIAHNCLGCNFEEGAKNISLFFKYNIETDSLRYFLTLYSMLFYIQAERLGVIYKELGFKVANKDEFDWSAFPVLQRIKYWANFFKHPKYYMLLHHPEFYIDGDPSIPNIMVNGKIDDAFIQQFYRGGKNNEELKTNLENKDKYIVVFPNILTFTQELCAELKKIVETITNDPKAIENLSAYTLENGLFT